MKFGKKYLLILTIFLFSVSGVSSAANYCVRDGASGSNDGSDWTDAYTDLPSTLERGSTYYIADGSYSGYTFNDAVSGTSLITIKKAIASDHGTSTGWSSSYGDGLATFGSFTFTTDYWVIDGQTGGGPGSWESGFGIKLDASSARIVRLDNDASNITFSHVDMEHYGRFTDEHQDGIYGLGASDNITVSYCYLHDICRCHILTRGTDGFILEYSKLARNGYGDGIHREAWSAGVDDNVIVRYCIFEDISNTGIICLVNGVGDAENWQIYGNVFWRTPGDGSGTSRFIEVKYADPDFTVGVNWKIYNNAIVNLQGLGAGISIENGSGNVAKNNIFYNNNVNSIPFSNTSHDYNWFEDNYRTNGCSPPCDLDPDLADSETNGIHGSADPFVDWENGDFDLTSGTNARDNGTDLGTSYDEDAYGNTRGADGDWDIGAYEYVSGANDTTAPSPDPMTWSTDPYATGDTSISMTATTATDVSGVEYYFDCTAGGGNDSGWQDSITYEDTGLSASTQYTYQVKARDKSSNQNETAYSTTKSATTNAADTTAPSPDPMTWATEPNATGTSSISMTATTATDTSGVEYYFDCTAGGGNDSGWQDSATYTDTGLSELTQYTYRVKARDKSSNNNETAYSTTKSATTQDGTAPSPDPMTWATEPYATGTSSISMTATTATDASGVEYYFDCTAGGGNDSGWQDSATYQDTGLSTSTQYSYRVKARDKSGNLNETAYSTVKSATTESTSGPSPTGWWQLDETSGSTAADSSGNSYDGTVTGATWDSNGHIDGALNFDGTTTYRCEIPSSSLSLSAGTVSLWGRLEATQSGTRYFFGHKSDPNNDANWADSIQLYMDNSDTVLDLGFGGVHPRHANIMTLSTNTWYHIALTWDGTNYVVYVDGVSKASGTYTGLTTLASFADIGNNGSRGNYPQGFAGLIDDVLIYDQALSKYDIADLVGITIASSPSPADNATDVSTTADLSWSAGYYAADVNGHDVYLGTDYNSVADANHSSSEFKGTQSSTTYDTGTMSGSTTYYWAIDEVNDSNTWAGDVWSFTTAGGDTTAPSPDPMTWATEPYAAGASSISMTATTATDSSGVEYYFECTAGGGNSSGWQDSTSYTDTGLSELTEYTYRVKARDKSSNQNETAYSTTKSATTQDGTAPTPDPMTWATDPYATGATSISMTATTATDSSGAEYYFDCTAGGGHSSGWQDSTTYEDTGLSELTEYTYRVKARDKSSNQNETAYSTTKSATTQDGTAPSPDPMTWATEPYATGTSSISMTATTATDASGVEYYFDCTAGGGHDSGWQDSATYTDTSLSELTQYTYRVKARDKSSNNNETTYSTTKSATTQDGTDPSPDPMTWATDPYATGTSSISMTATTATDVSGVEYYFDCTAGGGNDSSWQDSTTYEDTGLSASTQYTYKVRARDKSSNQNATNWSTEKSATTDANEPEPTGWWQLDETSGSTAADSSGNSYDGTVTGATWDSNGHIDGALNFDGTTTYHCEIPSSALSVSASTISLWGRLEGTQSGTRYFFGHNSDPNSDANWPDSIQLYMDGGNNQLDLGFGGVHPRHANIMTLSTNTWYHIALTWDGTNYVVYVDGVSKASGTYTGLTTLASFADIGNNGGRGSVHEGFAGLLDEICIYDAALSKYDIADLAGITIASSPSPADNATDVSTTADLSWSAGYYAADVNGHDVYLGTDYNSVADANYSSSEYKGNFDTNSYDPNGLSYSTTYYWAVDEVNDTSLWLGDIWNFATEAAPDTTAPSPDPMTWATEPNATGTSSISMIATTATDSSGVEYYFDCTAGGGNDSGWQDSTAYEDTGLDPNTQYSYRVKARDKSTNQNETAYSTVKSATTNAAQWTQLTYDEFESGWGSYTGGSNVQRYTDGDRAHQGDCALDIQGAYGDASAIWHTNAIDVDTPGYTQIEIDFWYYPRSMESGEGFKVEYYDGTQWNEVADYRVGVDFENEVFEHPTIYINESQYTFPTNMKIKFISDTSNTYDDAYLDEIKVSGK